MYLNLVPTFLYRQKGFLAKKSAKNDFPRGRSQTTFTAMGGGGVRQMSTLLNKYGKFY